MRKVSDQAPPQDNLEATDRAIPSLNQVAREDARRMLLATWKRDVVASIDHSTATDWSDSYRATVTSPSRAPAPALPQSVRASSASQQRRRAFREPR